MCGITGFITSDQIDSLSVIKSMTDAIVYRGPDDEGHWVSKDKKVALGQRRLSIIDLSVEGHQPMVSQCGRYVLDFNGEVYNFSELRTELQQLGHSFRGNCDTEVILNAFIEWGVERAVKRFIGMFAIAFWDEGKKQLFLVRDRLGIKPLYYGIQNDRLIFGSELKALRAFHQFNFTINTDALGLYLRHNYIVAPYSIYQHVYKLLPGSILEVSLSSSGLKVSDPVPYWSVKDTVKEGRHNIIQCGESELVNELEQLLKDATKRRMLADVPLGAFLSGGVDSSLVVALMQAQSNSPVKTFSIGFTEDQYNEAEYAKKVAEHLGTDHTELYMSPEDAMGVIPKLPFLYDEPFADSSQIPTFLVSQLARKHVTVSLSGDGGDELFGGYNRYFWGQSIWNKLKYCPNPLRAMIANIMCRVSPVHWDNVFNFISPVLPSSFKVASPGDKIHKLAGIMSSKNTEIMYQRLISQWSDPSQILKNNLPVSFDRDAIYHQNRYFDAKETDNFIERMMFIDTMTYLPDDILTKVDRASMGVSLEARVPILDHRVVEFAWKMPFQTRIKHNESKWALRQVLYKYVPKELIERPKMGFGVPIDRWLRGPLRDWAEDLLNENRLNQEGFLNAKPIRQKWQEHLSGRRNWQYHLWTILMFESWLAKNS